MLVEKTREQKFKLFKNDNSCIIDHDAGKADDQQNDYNSQSAHLVSNSTAKTKAVNGSRKQRLIPQCLTLREGKRVGVL